MFLMAQESIDIRFKNFKVELSSTGAISTLQIKLDTILCVDPLDVFIQVQILKTKEIQYYGHTMILKGIDRMNGIRTSVSVLKL